MMGATVSRYFHGPVAAVRIVLLVRALYLLLAVDIWLNFVMRGASYGAGGFNVAHFALLDAIQPVPSASLYTGMMVLISFAALAVAMLGQHRPLMILVCVLFSYGWMMSQLDIYQHHYFLSLLLFLSIFLPKVTAKDAVQIPNTPEANVASGGRPFSTISAWALPLIGIQVAILYFYAAISKLDSRWLAGNVMGNLSTAGDGASTDAVPVLGPLLGDSIWPLLAVGALVGELILAVGYVLAVCRDRSSSRIWAAAMWVCWITGMGLHVGVEWFHMKIGLFSYYMMALTCVFFLPVSALMPVAKVMAGIGEWFNQRMTRTTMQASSWGGWIIAAVVCAIALPVLIIMLDVPGTTIGMIVIGALAMALFIRAAKAQDRMQACGVVLVTAIYTALAGAFILSSNLRSDIYLTQAKFSHASHNFTDAIEQYDRAKMYRRETSGAEQTQFLTAVALNLGDAYQSTGKAKEAQASYQRAIELDPKIISARMNLSSLYSALGREADSAEMLVQVIELEPGHAGARYNMGVFLLSNQRLDSAIAQFKAAVQADPQMMEAQNNLATAYILTRNYAAAVPVLRGILKQTPDSVDALNNLAIILSTSKDTQIRDLDEAIRLAEQAVTLTQRQDTAVLGTLVRAYSESGRNEKVQTLLDEIATLRQRKAADGSK